MGTLTSASVLPLRLQGRKGWAATRAGLELVTPAVGRFLGASPHHHTLIPRLQRDMERWARQPQQTKRKLQKQLPAHQQLK